MNPSNVSNYATLAEWAADHADMRITCACSRTMNMPAATILERFGRDGPIKTSIIRLRCRGCGRRGHATVSPVPVLRR